MYLAHPTAHKLAWFIFWKVSCYDYIINKKHAEKANLCHAYFEDGNRAAKHETI